MRAITLLLAILTLVWSGCASHPPSTNMAAGRDGTAPDHGLAAGDGTWQRQESVAVALPTEGDASSPAGSPAIRRDLLRLPPVEVVGVSLADGRAESDPAHRYEAQSRLIPTHWDADVVRLLPTRWDVQAVLARQDEGRLSAAPLPTVPATCDSR
jgi:hypothetical protein